MIENQCGENGNDIYYRPVHTVESRLFEPLRETRIGLKNRVVQEIRGKINVGLGCGKRPFPSTKNRELRKITIPLLSLINNYWMRFL